MKTTAHEESGSDRARTRGRRYRESTWIVIQISTGDRVYEFVVLPDSLDNEDVSPHTLYLDGIEYYASADPPSRIKSECLRVLRILRREEEAGMHREAREKRESLVKQRRRTIATPKREI